MISERLVAAGPSLIAWTALDALGTAIILFGSGGPSGYAMAATLHLVAVGIVWQSSRLAPSHRLLLSALTLAMPVVGPPIAALALATRGRGELARALAVDSIWQPPSKVMDVSRLTDGLPACEALVSANQEQRRASLALLSRRADAESIAILRWAAGGPDPDLAVEAALALEDLGTRFDTRAAAAREALESHPGFDEALAAADILADGIHSGLADPSLLGPLVTEARRCYAQAEFLAPARLPDIAANWARLELSALSPTRALAVLDRARAAGAGPDVEVLYTHASTLAAHRSLSPAPQERPS